MHGRRQPGPALNRVQMQMPLKDVQGMLGVRVAVATQVETTNQKFFAMFFWMVMQVHAGAPRLPYFI